MSYRCNSSSPFVKVSKKCQESVTKNFEIFPGGNGSVRLAVIIVTINISYSFSKYQVYILLYIAFASQRGVQN